ncbi:MAG: hypothetical protein ACYC8T_02210 [Myxococcaceae bacterium]
MRALPIFVLLLGGPALGAAAPPLLPLRSARLYETGVGYYERSGRLDPAGVTLPVPAGHLDDALKTLVVLSKDGRVQGLEFGSSVSKGMARTLAGLPAAEGPISYPELLGSLKGAPVQVQLSRETFFARIIDVVTEEVVLEEARPASGKEPAAPARVVQELTVLLLTARQELRRVRAKDVVAVRPTDPAVAGRLGAALDALSTGGAQTRKSLRLAGTSSAVTLGYVAEAPLWRTTYRLVIDAGGKALLQGWALLHNDTDEDWGRVKVELVNGRPDSFLFPLAAPRYARRQLVAPQNALSTVPQLIGTTVDALWGDHLDEEGGIGVSGTGAGGGGSGYGMGMGSIGTVGRGAGTGSFGAGEGASGLLDVGNLAGVAQAEGVEAGALFTYTLAEPLDLRAHGSALVPFVMQPIEAKELTWIASVGEAPRSAVRFANSTRQTLPGGPIAFFTGGGFAGESALDRLKPGEKRIVQYGADLDLELTHELRSSSEEVKRLTFRGDALIEHFLRSSELFYSLENRSGRSRKVWLGLTLNANAKVTGAELDFDQQSGRPVAVFEVPGRGRLERTLKAVEGLQRQSQLTALTAARLLGFASMGSLTESDRKAARAAAEKQTGLERADLEAARAKAGIAEAEGDLARLRENLKALGGEKGAGSVAAENPFVQRVLAGEDRLSALRRQLAALAAERPGRVAAVRGALATLK